MDKSDYMYIDKWSKKIKAINFLGGKCSRCGEDNIFVLTFHHINPNEKIISVSRIFNYRWSIIENELKKCILLCENCHREEHYKNENDKQNKKIFLEYKNIYECDKCGYNHNIGALEFHHKEDSEKSFNIGSIGIRLKTVFELEKYIKEELDKCDVLCANCHRIKHTGIIKFDKYKNLIYNKKIKEQIRPIKPEVIKEMLDSGMKQIDIIKKLKIPSSTLSGIIKRNNL